MGCRPLGSEYAGVWEYMKIEILGCSGSVMKGFNTTSILVNGDVLIDAGSAASALEIEELAHIRYILLTHSHIDHIKELPFILDTVFSSQRQDGITVYGSADTIEVLKKHIFNGLIWPDMEELKVDETLLRFEFVPQGWFMLGDIRVRALEVDHIPGSLGYVLGLDGRYVIFSGDTGYSQGLFDYAASLGKDLEALFIETSFPERMARIARLSQHLTPGMLRRGVDGIDPQARVISYHIKPQYGPEVIAELPGRVEYIQGGEVFEL